MLNKVIHWAPLIQPVLYRYRVFLGAGPMYIFCVENPHKNMYISKGWVWPKCSVFNFLAPSPKFFFVPTQPCWQAKFKKRLGLRIKVPLSVFVRGDNQSVLWNTTIPDSTLKKKSNSIAYHFVREGAARDEWRTAYVKTDQNPSDLMTKALPSGANRKRKIRMLMYDIYPEDCGWTGDVDVTNCNELNTCG